MVCVSIRRVPGVRQPGDRLVFHVKLIWCLWLISPAVRVSACAYVFGSFRVDTASVLGDRSGGEGLLVARSGTHMRAYTCRHRAFLLRSLARDADPRAGVVSRETQRRSSMHEHRPTTLGSSSHSCWRPARPCCHTPLLPRSGSTVAVTRTWTATCPGRAWTAAARAEIAVLVTILLRHPSRIILAMPISVV